MFSVQFSHSVVSDSLWPHGLQHNVLNVVKPKLTKKKKKKTKPTFTHGLVFSRIYFYFYLFIFIYFYYYYYFYCSGFFHTLKWNSQGFTCVPHPDRPSQFFPELRIVTLRSQWTSWLAHELAQVCRGSENIQVFWNNLCSTICCKTLSKSFGPSWTLNILL